MSKMSKLLPSEAGCQGASLLAPGASEDRWLIGGDSPVFTSASLPVCPSPNCPFLKGHRSYWTRIYLNDAIATWSPLGRPYFK